MIMKMFAVYDSKAEAYLQPFFMPTKGQAIRAFQAAANKEGHDFNVYSADFTLFEIGEYDDSNGVVTPLPHKLNLGGAHEHIKNSVASVANVSRAGVKNLRQGEEWREESSSQEVAQ